MHPYSTLNIKHSWANYDPVSQEIKYWVAWLWLNTGTNSVLLIVRGKKLRKHQDIDRDELLNLSKHIWKFSWCHRRRWHRATSAQTFESLSQLFVGDAHILVIPSVFVHKTTKTCLMRNMCSDNSLWFYCLYIQSNNYCNMCCTYKPPVWRVWLLNILCHWYIMKFALVVRWSISLDNDRWLPIETVAGYSCSAYLLHYHIISWKKTLLIIHHKHEILLYFQTNYGKYCLVFEICQI